MPLSSLLGVGGGKEAVLEGPILLGRLVFNMELARLREHALNARGRSRATKTSLISTSRCRSRKTLTWMCWPGGKVRINQKDGLPILAKMAHQFLGRPASSAAAEWLPIGCADHQWRRDAQCWKLVVGEHWQRLQREEAWRRAQPTAAKRDLACSIARCARVPVQYCTTVPVSGYLTIRNIRRLFYGIWIYPDHPPQLSVSTRWQISHYPVNPDGA